MIRLAVCGSCVTRDLFNEVFVSDYKRYFDCVADSYQVSLISLMSRPSSIEKNFIDDIDLVAQAAMRYEFSRQFLADFHAFKPEMIVIDFCPDVRSGCIVLSDGSIVTRNRWRVVKTRIYRENTEHELVPGTLEYFHLWTKAVDQFVAFIRSSAPSCKIVLHRVQNALSYRQNNGILTNFAGAQELAEMNIWWNTLNDWFVEHYADAVLDVWTNEVASFEGHHWGSWPVHYEMGYHQKASNRLLELRP